MFLDDRILLEETGTDTLSSVRAIWRLSREHGPMGHVMVATSAYHLPRCLILLYLIGIPAMPCKMRLKTRRPALEALVLAISGSPGPALRRLPAALDANCRPPLKPAQDG